MPCYHPMLAYRSKDGKNENGKWPIVFDPKEGYSDMTVKLPCGQCIGCRLERSRQWAVRCMHEAQMHDQSCFVTLTFNDFHVRNTLVKRDFQLFMKRLRKAIEPDKVRYFHCGEYGDMYSRPHHHACLFGFDFPDKVYWKTKNGVDLYISAMLQSLWTDPKTKTSLGYCTIGNVTFESAAYVARYVLKKKFGAQAKEVYKERIPEYVTMSRRPGIGSTWFEKFSSDVYPSDEVVVRKKIMCKPPKYYDRIYDQIEAISFEAVKRERAKQAHKHEKPLQRLIDAEIIKKQQIGLLRREVEE